MSPFEIVTLLDIATLKGMKFSRSYGAPIYSETLGYFAKEGLIEGHQIDLDYPKITERGRAYVAFLQAMPLPVTNWSIPGPWAPSMPPGHQNGKECA
ncbi:hypothetical protein [Comamonas testosteroni]|uniref:hypothetical protein n=1 Tax=Comamonas testosteroni TaxID=285 RepID=UPI0006B94D02|nr:hypothetical protein [Comamonas testosteroni]